MSIIFFYNISVSFFSRDIYAASLCILSLSLSLLINNKYNNNLQRINGYRLSCNATQDGQIIVKSHLHCLFDKVKLTAIVARAYLCQIHIIWKCGNHGYYITYPLNCAPYLLPESRYFFRVSSNLGTGREGRSSSYWKVRSTLVAEPTSESIFYGEMFLCLK